MDDHVLVTKTSVNERILVYFVNNTVHLVL